MPKSNKKTFRIDYTDPEGQKFEGAFTCKRQTIRDKSTIAVRTTEINGGFYCVTDDNDNYTGQGIDPNTVVFNRAIATLETVILSKPQWFDLDEMYDENLVSMVWKEVRDFESSFLVSKEDSGSEPLRTGTGDTKSKKPKQRSTIEKVVDEEVQDAMDS